MLVVTVTNMAMGTLAIKLDSILAVKAHSLELGLAARLEVLPCPVKGLLDLAPGTFTVGLGRIIDIDAGDKDLIRGSLDKLDVDGGNAFDETATHFDDFELDLDDLQVLLLIKSLGHDSEAVSQELLLMLAVVPDDGGSQVAMPRVGVGVQLVAIEGEPGAVLHFKVHAQVRVLALALPAGHIDALAEGHDGHIVGGGFDGERLVDLFVSFGYLGNEEEGGGRGREEELFQQHGGLHARLNKRRRVG